MDYNWLSPKAEARPAGAKGWGSFALEPILAGETVAAFGGWIVTGSYLTELSHDRQSRSIQGDSDLFLVSGDTPEAELRSARANTAGRHARYRTRRGDVLRLRDV